MWVVLLNTGAGGASARISPDRLRDLFRQAGIAADVRSVRSPDIEHVSHRAAREPGVTALVAAGGDGTVSAVAAAASAAGIPLAILPLGTRNHFARDLGIPLDPASAIRAAAAGRVRAVDVGEVNGHVFVNNSSVGLYPALVRERDRHVWRRRSGKLFATLRAAWRVIGRVERHHVLLASRDKGVVRDASFVFVGNNDYDPRFLSGRARESLDAGQLSLWVPKRPPSRTGFLRLALRAAFGRLKAAKDLDQIRLPEVWVDIGRRHVRVATDGEVLRMKAPLHYRIRPRALRVLAPP